jgi:hypothetical protein
MLTIVTEGRVKGGTHPYKLSMPAVMRKYRKEKSFGTRANTLVLPNEYKAKRLLAKTWHNPYTKKEAIVREKLLVYESLWIGAESRQGWEDIREEVILLFSTVHFFSTKC